MKFSKNKSILIFHVTLILNFLLKFSYIHSQSIKTEANQLKQPKLTTQSLMKDIDQELNKKHLAVAIDKALKLAKLLKGQYSKSQVIILLLELADTYYQENNFMYCIPFYEGALSVINDEIKNSKINSKDKGIIIDTKISILDKVSFSYKSLKLFIRSKDKLLERLLEIEKVYTKKSNKYATNLNNIGLVLINSADYNQSLVYLDSSKIMFENLQDIKDNNQYQTCLNNLGLLYYHKGDFEKSEFFYNKSLALIDTTKSKNLIKFANYHNNIGGLYSKFYLYKKAIIHYKKALSIYSQFGTENLDYAMTMLNIAIAYEQLYNFEQSINLVKEALNILILTKQWQYLPNAYNSLANLFYYKGDVNESIQCIVKALDIVKHTNDIEKAFLLNRLATFYFKIGFPERMEAPLLEALKIYQKSTNANNLDYLETLDNLSLCYYRMPTRIDSIYRISHVDRLQNYQILTDILSDRYSLDFQKKLKLSIDTYNSFYYRYPDSFYDTHGLLLEDELHLKEYILYKNLLLRKKDIGGKSLNTIKQLNKWLALQKQIVFYQFNPKEASSITIPDLIVQAEQLEDTLKYLTKNLYSANGKQKISWQSIRNNLKPRQTLVEFMHFNYYNNGRWTDSTYYAALVLRSNDSHPHYVPLFEEKEIQQLLVSPNKPKQNKDIAYRIKADSLYSLDKISVTTTAQKLYSLVWEPLDSLIKDGEEVFFAPSGELHKLAFPAIMTPLGKRLVDRYKLHQISSGRQIVSDSIDFKLPEHGTVALFGAIKYDSLPPLPESKIEPSMGNSIAAVERGERFVSLNWSANEVNQIASAFAQKKYSITKFTSDTAREENFKKLKSPTVLLLSTHGFYKPIRRETSMELNRQQLVLRDRIAYIENPLLRSGLALAGANRVWEGGQPREGEEDGVLTALEVSNQDLSGTQLVVLSACETGLGDVQGSEGVYGLQRAFKQAGVRYLLVSLWRVNDGATSILITDFFKRLLNGDTAERAFTGAQRKLRESSNYSSPYYWAGFTLMK